MVIIGKTNIGKKREINEDTIFVSDQPIGSLPNLCIVADGMGGHNGGEVASSKSVSFFCGYIMERECLEEDLLDFLTAAAAYANTEVHKLSKSDVSLNGMGTTFTACVIKNGRAYIVHVGDSRLYSLSGHTLKQQTTDHTYINEMIKAGLLTPEQARSHPKRNMLTRVLGVDDNIQTDGLLLDAEGLNAILLCSDGLTGMLTNEDITNIIIDYTEPEQKALALIDAANALGGNDNISVILIDFLRGVSEVMV